MASVSNAFQSAESRVKAYREAADLAVRRASSSGGRDGSIIASGGGGAYGMASTSGRGNVNLSQHAEQLRYFRDTVYAAIRPIATRAADQEFQVGVKVRTKRKMSPVAKSGQIAQDEFRTRNILKRAPRFVKEDAGIEVLEDHAILDSLEDPNPVATEWQLKYFTVASLMLTGKAYWHFLADETGKLSIWPYPSSWIKPDHSGGPFGKFHLEIPGIPSGNFPPIDGREMCFFLLPDPGNPTGAMSPLQAAAKGVTIEEFIGKAQVQSYRNGIFPGIAIKAGSLPGVAPGIPGGRYTFNAKQRRQLLEAVKLSYQGWEHHNDPIILDGLIEEVFPFSRSPQEMDFQASAKAVEDKIMLLFGVNPISAGRVEGANRASAYVADEHLISNVVNPILRLISETMTKRIGPLFSNDRQKLYLWIEKASPHDEELTLKKWEVGVRARAVMVNEYRENILGMPPIDGGDVLAAPAPKPAQEGGGENKPGKEGNGEGDETGEAGGGKPSGGKPAAGGGKPETGGGDGDSDSGGAGKSKSADQFITRKEFDFFVQGLGLAAN